VTNSDTSSYQPQRLDKAAARVATSAQTVGEICAALSLAARIGPNSNSELLGPLQSVRDDLRAAAGDLMALGAELPKRADARGLDALTELRKLDASRTEALALLDALRHAHALAEALDARRGDVLDAPVGGSAGLVWGDRLIQAVCGLELELFGPASTVTGGRE
jgi:cob(I)alamin adenosyltransferase